MKTIIVTFLMFVILFGVVGTGLTNNRTDDPLGVAVSPQTLLLGWDQGGSVAVHTSIPYSSVAVETVELNEIAVNAAKADSCGNLVAYFDEDAVKAIVAPPSAVMVLTGSRKDGTAFSGSDDVPVVQR